MRYIHKNTVEPPCMSDWKQAQTQAGLRCDRYADFPDKKVLNEVLRDEQHGLCCYCQRPMDHYQGEAEMGSHNEHLYPENGQPQSAQLQMDYRNLYACCIDSKGHKKKERHLRYCGEAKEDQLIPLLIQDPKCTNYFRYNVLGEVIPNGEYGKWSDYVSHKSELFGKVKEAYECIAVLNLNCTILVSDRQYVMQDIMKLAMGRTKEEINHDITNLMSRSTFVKYHELILQILNCRVAVLL